MSGLAAVVAVEVDAAAAVFEVVAVGCASVEAVAFAPQQVAIVAAGMVVGLAARRRCRDQPVFLPR